MKIKTMETVSDFILGGSKITADGGCSHEIKRRLLLGRKVMTNLDSIFKSRDITEPLFDFPETYSKFPLAVYFTYGNVSFHVTLSIHLTLSFPLPMSISLFSMSVSPLVPCK